MSLRIGDRGNEVATLRADMAVVDPSVHVGDDVTEAGAFDAVLDQAVRKLQGRYQLVTDGIVGPYTRAALQMELQDVRAPLPDVSRMSPLSARASEIAHSALLARVRETPLGSNRGASGPFGGVDDYLRWHGYGEQYVQYTRSTAAPDGWRGAPWCAAFIAWCVNRAASELQLPFELRAGTDLMGCAKWRRAGIQHEAMLSVPEPGCVGLVSRNGSLAHAVLITRVGPDGVWSIEGNGYGDRVRAVKRAPSAFGALVRVD